MIHERRATLRAYLRQQRGYGAGEGLLYKKYPLRTPERVGLYGGSGSWLSALLGGPRVYHGAFGRGLFQSVYAGADIPWISELPQTIEWLLLSLLLAIAGIVSPLLGTLGCLRHHHMDRHRDFVRRVGRCRWPHDDAFDAGNSGDAVSPRAAGAKFRARARPLHPRARSLRCGAGSVQLARQDHFQRRTRSGGRPDGFRNSARRATRGAGEIRPRGCGHRRI